MLGPRVALVIALMAGSAGAAGPPSNEHQIATAVSPAPEEDRAGATVLGYGANGDLITLRQGDGDLVCLADDPSDERFHAACYHHSLEPFMARGRELKARKLERAEVTKIRGEEVAAGTLAMPDGPAALYSLTGKLENWDAASGTLAEGNRVYVIYVPYATEESTGLPPKPVTDGGPWLMAPGEPWAHIMVVQASDPTGG